MEQSPKRKLTPKMSQEFKFQKAVHGRESVRRQLSVPVFDVKQVNVEKFKDKLLRIGSNAGWLKNFQLETEKVTIPKLHDIQLNFVDTVDLEEAEFQDVFSTHFNSLKITERECQTIECLTRSQHHSDLWSLAREERITASNFGRICKLKKTTQPDASLKDQMNYSSFDTSTQSMEETIKVRPEENMRRQCEVLILD